MNDFILGMVSIGFFVAALFFVRFYRETGDRFFLWFTVSFLIMSVNQVALQVFGETQEFFTALYIVRLVAFIIILVAIVDKNRSSTPA